MIIQVDQEGKNVIEQFCDVSLKVGGIQNLNQVNLVLGTLVLLSKPAPAVPTQQQEQPEQPEQSESRE